MFNYPGAFHIHSKYSDGSGTIPEIIECAKKAGLKWIVISDHNNLEGLYYEGINDGVYTIVGSEISPENSNHLVALNIKEKIDRDIGPRNYINEVHNQGGICFVAHPDESIKRENNQKPLRWEDWSIDSFDGIEIWNYLSDWTDQYTTKKIEIFQYINRHKIVKGPTKAVLKWWDELNKKSETPFPAIGGVDAHCFLLNYFGLRLKLAEYYDYFSTLNNVVSLEEPLSEDFPTAKEQILSALKNANFFIINRKAAKNRNFPEIFIESKDKQISVGNCYDLEKYSKLTVKLPEKSLIKLVWNGIYQEEFNTKSLEYELLQKGKLRLEIFCNNLPYIFSNYFFIK